MKILHTSDWHLGQKFIYFDRQEEHRLALDWILETIIEEEIELIIVAGDIFDIGNPPNYARTLYYNFLKNLLKTNCQNIVIVGGNHDSPSMLEAPKDLLKEFNIYIVGSASDKPESDIIELKDSKGKLLASIAAVPFLRDRDLRASVTGETGSERIERIRTAIKEYYQNMGSLMEKYAKANVPKIVTGHLYTAASEASDTQNNIYIGDKENIKAKDFPAIFDYVALGHIHRPQSIDGIEKIRYSGSIIPLSFSETKDEKSVTILNFNGDKLEDIQVKPMPTFRRLKTIEGTLEEIQERLEEFNSRHIEELTSWVEIIIHTEKITPNIDADLREYVKDMNLEILKIRLNRPYFALDTQVGKVNLEELAEEEVFMKKCLSAGYPPEEMDELKKSFLELQDWMQQADIK